MTIAELSPSNVAAESSASALSSTLAWHGFAWLCAGILLGFAIAIWRLGKRERARRDADQAPARVVAAIADSNPDAVVLFSDDGGGIRFANAAARELFFDGKDPAGQSFLHLIANAPAPLREALLGESDRLFNIEADGQRETFHVSRRFFTLDERSHTLLIVKHLTREIARREVDVLKRVIRVLSHEVNNSLAPVSSLVHSARKIAQGSEPGSKLTRVFDTIEERTRHLATFLEGYANLARLPDPRPRRIEWEPFLRQIAELYPEVRLPHPPSVAGYFDPVQVEQVVINLLKNAVEAGSAIDAIELAARVDGSGDTELKVRDRGPGFSEEALRNALMPLYTTKERGGGMGLALCREIAEAHGGSIGLGNADDGGSWVSVRLPGPLENPRGLTRSKLTLSQG